MDTIVAQGSINPGYLEGTIMRALNTFYTTQWAMYETLQLSRGVATAPTYEEICQFLIFLDKTIVLWSMQRLVYRMLYMWLR